MWRSHTNHMPVNRPCCGMLHGKKPLLEGSGLLRRRRVDWHHLRRFDCSESGERRDCVPVHCIAERSDHRAEIRVPRRSSMDSRAEGPPARGRGNQCAGFRSGLASPGRAEQGSRGEHKREHRLSGSMKARRHNDKCPSHGRCLMARPRVRWAQPPAWAARYEERISRLPVESPGLALSPSRGNQIAPWDYIHREYIKGRNMHRTRLQPHEAPLQGCHRLR